MEGIEERVGMCNTVENYRMEGGGKRGFVELEGSR